MAPAQPEWRIPSNLQSLIDADDDLTWESDDWSPIQLSVMGGTSYNERDIDQAWQIEYEPEGCTGYALLDRIVAAVNERAPDIHADLHCDDTEDSTVVIWVESEAVCRRLLAIVWPMVDHS